MTIETIVYSQLIIIAEDIANVFIDAYKIKVALSEKYDKAIKHGINGAVYIALAGLLIWTFHMTLWPQAVVFLFSALLARQVFFDVGLNVRRFGWSQWGYVTLDDPPAAIFDRIEIKLFGRNGKKITIGYGICWLISLAGLYFL